MKEKRIEIDSAIYAKLNSRFKDDLVLHTSATDIDNGYVQTTWSLSPYETPFIEYIETWEPMDDEEPHKRRYFLYIPVDTKY